jgi:hypothetical protein
MSRKRALSFVAASTLVACSLTHDGDRPAAVGRVHAAISAVPPFTFCVQVIASAGRSVNKLVDVTPGQTSSVDLDNVPIGNVDFAAFAYGQACATVTDSTQPSYASAPTPALVQPGQVTALELTLLPVGGAHVGINFGDDDGGVPDMAIPNDLAVGPDLAVAPDLAPQPAHLTASLPSFNWNGSTQPKDFTITNDGATETGPLTVALSTVFFQQTTSCGPSLTPGASCTVTVTPAAFPFSMSGTLTVSSTTTSVSVSLATR